MPFPFLISSTRLSSSRVTVSAWISDGTSRTVNWNVADPPPSVGGKTVMTLSPISRCVTPS